MSLHPAFNVFDFTGKKEIRAFRRYPDNTRRIVTYHPVSEGTKVLVGDDGAGRNLYLTVTKIVDQRPSKGDFQNHDNPISYRVVLENV